MCYIVPKHVCIEHAHSTVLYRGADTVTTLSFSNAPRPPCRKIWWELFEVRVDFALLLLRFQVEDGWSLYLAGEDDVDPSFGLDAPVAVKDWAVLNSAVED